MTSVSIQKYDGDTAGFDYSQLDEYLAEELQQDTRLLRMSRVRAYEEIVRQGTILKKWKERLPYGTFLSWLRQEFAMTEDTAKNYMNVAQHFPRINSDTSITMGALYKLSRSGVSDGERQVALELASTKEQVTADIADMIRLDANIGYLVILYKEDQITGSMARQIGRRLNDSTLPQPVRQAAIQWKIQDIAALDYLCHAYTKHERTSGKNTAWCDLLHNQGMMVAGDFQKHISKATESDIQIYTSFRQYGAIQESIAQRESQFHIQRTQATIRSIRSDQITLDIPHLDIPIATGDTIEIEIRMRKNEKEK